MTILRLRQLKVAGGGGSRATGSGLVGVAPIRRYDAKKIVRFGLEARARHGKAD